MIKKELKKFYFIDEEDVKIPNWTLNSNLTFTTTYTHTGNIMINNNRIHSLGSVIWNQELNRLEFWDGAMWQHLTNYNVT